MSGVILSLDLATTAGWAFGSPENGVCGYGAHRLPKTGDDVGAYLAAFREWLTKRIEVIKPWTIYFESPVMMGRGKTTLTTLRKIYSPAGVTELVAHDHGLDCREANVSDISTHFLGKGAPRIGDARKKATIARCRERGWQPECDNAADALALLDYAFSLIAPQHALEATPLFGEDPASGPQVRTERAAPLKRGALA